jgi:hypothetical protein
MRKRLPNGRLIHQSGDAQTAAFLSPSRLKTG